MSDQPTIVLGIETAGTGGSLALLREGQLLAERVLEVTGRRHAQTLVAELARLCDEVAVRPSGIGLVAISIGPGSFTGLRVGCTMAKTLCYATEAKLVAVDSLLASATAWSGGHSRVWAIEDAQRGEVFLGEYHRTPEGFERRGEITIVKAAAWLEQLPPGDVVLGPGLSRSQALRTSATRIEASLAPPPARIVAELGRKAAARGEFADPWTIEPFYLRLSAAEEKAAKG